MIILVILKSNLRLILIVTDKRGYYTTLEAAKMLDVSVRTVQLWVEDGKLQGWKTAGGHRRIAVNSVENMLEGQQAAPLKKSSKKPVILIVEDNPTVMKLYQAAIESWDLPIQVISVENGFLGLMEVGRSRPNLIITDIFMPGMDGLQMIHALYKEVNLDKVKIVVISGLSQEEIQYRGGIPQGIPFYKKPVDLNKLKEIVQQTIANQKQDQ